MPQSPVFQIRDKVLQKLFSDRVGIYVTIILLREPVNMLNYRIIDSGVVFRLTSGALFKNFPDKICEEDTLQRFLLTEVVYIVLPRLAGTDRLNNL